MLVTPTSLPEVLVIQPKVFGDERGFFLESFNQRAFDAAVGRSVRFVQDNHSRSQHGVLRGLHYQLPPHDQGKLVRVAQGCVFDVVVDLRRSSASFGRWMGMELSGENHKQVWVPPGCAHGFLVLSDSADVLYKVTSYYAPQAEVCIRWDDPALGVTWPTVQQIVLSTKDRSGRHFSEAPAFD
jgi:dTDP-4-dehydrorhamnose 3,5-epimerase